MLAVRSTHVVMPVPLIFVLWGMCLVVVPARGGGFRGSSFMPSFRDRAKQLKNLAKEALKEESAVDNGRVTIDVVPTSFLEVTDSVSANQECPAGVQTVLFDGGWELSFRLSGMPLGYSDRLPCPDAFHGKGASFHCSTDGHWEYKGHESGCVADEWCRMKSFQVYPGSGPTIAKLATTKGAADGVVRKMNCRDLKHPNNLWGEVGFKCGPCQGSKCDGYKYTWEWQSGGCTPERHCPQSEITVTHPEWSLTFKLNEGPGTFAHECGVVDEAYWGTVSFNCVPGPDDTMQWVHTGVCTKVNHCGSTDFNITFPQQMGGDILKFTLDSAEASSVGPREINCADAKIGPDFQGVASKYTGTASFQCSGSTPQPEWELVHSNCKQASGCPWVEQPIKYWWSEGFSTEDDVVLILPAAGHEESVNIPCPSPYQKDMFEQFLCNANGEWERQEVEGGGCKKEIKKRSSFLKLFGF